LIYVVTQVWKWGIASDKQPRWERADNDDEANRQALKPRQCFR
jgi:hypothetical protein